MASKEPTHTPEFKAEVALKALAQSKKNLDQLSDEYDVPVSVILTWAVQLERNAAHVYITTSAPEDIRAELPEEVIVDVEDDDISESLHHGVMHDDLNYKKLVFWAGLGIVFVIIFVQSLKYMYASNMDALHHRNSKKSAHYQVNEEKKADRKRLATYGVIDLDKGIYRMPIDTVIDEMAVDVNTK